jgi:hypothetical protein
MAQAVLESRSTMVQGPLHDAMWLERRPVVIICWWLGGTRASAWVALNVQTAGGCLADARCVVCGQTGKGSGRGLNGGGKCSGIGGVKTGEFLIQSAGWCCGGK